MNNSRILVIDSGNTALKYAVFENDKILDLQRIGKDDFTTLKSVYTKFQCSGVAISSVRSDKKTSELITAIAAENTFELTYPYHLNFKLDYKTPELLGKDRLCNAAAALSLSTTEYALTIDFGTCIKLDLISKQSGYMGGSISPGIQLRYNALNDYTDNLPRLDERKEKILIGKSTNESIIAGVLTGIEAEINQLILRFEQKYSPLTIFVTGGDSSYFDLVSKNDIFAVENLTLIGLYQLYIQKA